jgi:hypothetical protein
MNEHVRTFKHENQVMKLSERRCQMLIVKDTAVFYYKISKIHSALEATILRTQIDHLLRSSQLF